MIATSQDLFVTLTPCETPASARSADLARAPRAPLTPSPPLLGDYRLLAPLASGGMGELFIACHRSVGYDELVPLADLVVVKRVLPHLAKDEHLATMFRDEALLAAQLRHANVCRVLEVGRARDGWFLVMEYLHGVALSRVLRRLAYQRQRLDVRAVAGLVVQSCAGLQYAHDARGADGMPLGIVHRDISPPNILLTSDGTVKLLDFGIAKAASASTKTRTGTLKGKNAYMAPEQIVGGTIDRRTDVFALGIVLYELLAGARLFQRDNDFLTFKAITEEPLPDIRERRPEVSSAIAGVLHCALAREPAQRFGSAAELAAALELATQRVGGPASSGELGWSLDREFGDEMLERDTLLHRARRAALHATVVTAAGTPPPPPPPPKTRAGESIEVTDEDLMAWMPAPSATAAPLTPAWFVISEPEMEFDMRPNRSSNIWRSPLRMKALGVSVAIAALIGGALLLHASGGGSCPPCAATAAPAPPPSAVIAPAAPPPPPTCTDLAAVERPAAPRRRAVRPKPAVVQPPPVVVAEPVAEPESPPVEPVPPPVEPVPPPVEPAPAPAPVEAAPAPAEPPLAAATEPAAL